MHAEPSRFADLFNKPSVEELHRLSPKEFERFVAYLMRRAGYEAKEVGPHFLRGLDIELREPGKHRIVGGIECKRLEPGQLVGAPVVRGIRGAPAVESSGAKPYIITTSDFNAPAHHMATAGRKHVHLINGEQLIRYINYVRGSRYDDDDSPNPIPPEYFAGTNSIRPRAVGATKILAIANNKGGVGKTTTTYYLGAELASRGYRVLLVDLDSQANLTERCLPNQIKAVLGEVEHRPSIVQYFSQQHKLTDLVVPTRLSNLYVIPSDPFLRLRDPGGSGRPLVELKFAEALKDLCMSPPPILGGPPEWIIFDTPPAMSLLTRVALAASQYVLAPIRPRSPSVQGTQYGSHHADG